MGTLFNVDGSTGNLTTAGSITSTSTTSGFLLPKLTTTQRDAIASPATGLEIFNTTTNQIEFYTGSVWSAVGGGSGTVSSGTSGQLTYYGATGTTVSGTPFLSVDSSGLILNGVNVGIRNSNGFGIASSSSLTLSGSPSVTISSNLRIAGNNSITMTDAGGSPNTVSIQAPSAITSSYTLKMPTLQGSANTFLQNDGSGNLSWAAGAGGVTGSGSTNSIPVWTSSSAIGNSGMTDNGTSLAITSRLFSVNYPGSLQNPTSEYFQKFHSTSIGAGTNAYTYLTFLAAANYASATAIATIGSGSNGAAELLINGVGFSNGAFGFCDKVIVCVQGNSATVNLISSANVGSFAARTYTATASGGTGTLNMQMSGNAATFQVTAKMVTLSTV